MLLAVIITTCLDDGIYSRKSKEICVPVEVKIYRNASEKGCFYNQQRKKVQYVYLLKKFWMYNWKELFVTLFLFIYSTLSIYIIYKVFCVFVSSFHHH